LWHGTLVCWHIKIQLKSGPVTADLTTTVIHNSKLLINDIKPDQSLAQIKYFTKIQQEEHIWDMTNVSTASAQYIFMKFTRI